MRRVAPLLLSTLLLGGVALHPHAASAQAETREGIYLQNQILQLRQEVESLRASGGGGSSLGNSAPPPSSGQMASGQSQILNQLLSRVGDLEDQVRQLRGRVEENAYKQQQTQAALDKLSGDVDFRLQALEGGNGGAAGAAPGAGPAPAGRPPAGNVGTPPRAPAQAAADAAPQAARTPQRALTDGQQALSRRDYPAAEAAAREVLAGRGATYQVDGKMLLGDALLARGGTQNTQQAALAFNDAYTRARTGPRAPDALVGLANSFTALGSKREACDTLDQLRSEFPSLKGAAAQNAADARRKASCR